MIVKVSFREITADISVISPVNLCTKFMKLEQTDKTRNMATKFITGTSAKYAAVPRELPPVTLRCHEEGLCETERKPHSFGAHRASPKHRRCGCRRQIEDAFFRL